MSLDAFATIATFAAVYAALYTAHEVGDHWTQTHSQATRKGEKSWAGRLACTWHVVTLTITKIVLLAIAGLVLDLDLNPFVTGLVLVADGLTHWWADRRTTLLKLADKLSVLIPGKGDFARLGDGAKAPCGTGAYALDQSWHILWIFVAALAIAALS